MWYDSSECPQVPFVLVQAEQLFAHRLDHEVSNQPYDDEKMCFSGIDISLHAGTALEHRLVRHKTIVPKY